jgi:di/tricarboxylate transporter
MTLQIAFLFALLAVMVYLFLTEKLPVDLTAFLGLVVLIFAGYVTPSEAFQGFSSPAVITMLSVFIVGAALLETGVADVIGNRIHAFVGSNESLTIVTLMVTAGVLSAFMNNIAATAVLMPAVATLAPRAGLAPSRLFMPLAFGAILGGTTTLVGTPPNILAAQVMVDRGMEPFHLFDFTPIGLAILALGTVFMLTIGKRLLPDTERGGAAAGEGGADLLQIYQLEDRIFSLRLPANTSLAGRTLAETRLGSTLGVKVVTIHRGDRAIEPEAGTVLRAGDVLAVDGEPSHVQRFLDLEHVEAEPMPAHLLPAVSPGVEGVRVAVQSGSPLAGQTLRELDFRNRFGVVVLAVRHRRRLYTDHLALQTVRKDDELLAVGLRDDLDRFAAQPGLEIVEAGLAAPAELQDRLWVITVAGGSGLAGSTIRDSRLGTVAGLTVAGIIRDGVTRLAISPAEEIRAGDRLLVAADLGSVEALSGGGEIEFGPAIGREVLDTDQTQMVEVAVAPRSAAEGRDLEELDFHDRYGLVALALWRDGKPRHTNLARIPLRFGDALLLHGSREKIRKLAGDADFLVLSAADQAPRRLDKAKYAFGSLLLMIALVATGWQPIHVAAFTAASLAILAGALTMKEAYRVIEWRAIFLVAAVLPVGFAMERSGAAQFLSDSVASTAGTLGPYAVLAALVVLASLLSQGLDGAPAVVLLAPVAFEMADKLSLSPYPLMMGLSLAASAAFMTPFSHKANLLVMGAGGYKSKDYLRVGTPLTVLVLILIILMVPVFFPF